MIKVIIDKEKILKEHSDYDRMYDYSGMNTISAIKQFQAIIYYGQEVLEVDEINEYGYAYIKYYNSRMPVKIVEE